jgi:putative heme-binding domain-containing protein
MAERWAGPDQLAAVQAFLKRQITSGGNAADIAAAFNILRRLGPDALAGLSADTLTIFFDHVLDGSIALPAPVDRIAALKLLEGVEAGQAGPRFAAAMLADPDPPVRLQALHAVRLIGWQSPELFDAVWTRLRQPKLDLNEQLTAIVTLGSQDKPDPVRWKELLASPQPQVARTALRTCKQFAGNEPMRGMLLAELPALLASKLELRDDASALLSLFSIDASHLAKMKLPAGLAARPAEEIEKEMLAHLASADPRLGQDVFERIGCAACHDVAGKSQMFGPSLRDIGKGASAASIAESILFPSRVIKDGFETQIVRTKSGQELEGWVEQHGAEVIVVRGGSERVRIKADDIVERRKLDRSPMPDVSMAGLSIDELCDLLNYLVSQGGQTRPPATTRPATPHAAAGGGKQRR